jgi:sulfur carrier protein
MRIELNGNLRDVPDGATVAELVVEAGAAPEARGVAVAVDGEVVPRGAWAETPVGAGQTVEVLEAIQGG